MFEIITKYTFLNWYHMNLDTFGSIVWIFLWNFVSTRNHVVEKSTGTGIGKLSSKFPIFWYLIESSRVSISSKKLFLYFLCFSLMISTYVSSEQINWHFVMFQQVAKGFVWQAILYTFLVNVRKACMFHAQIYTLTHPTPAWR